MKKSIQKLAVVLDEPDRVYSTGDQVNGKIIIDLTQEAQIPKLSLQCYGEAYVSWPENAGTYTRYYYHREEYFKTKACVYNEVKLNPSSQGVLQPNTYTFSFCFVIPCKVLPPSYESIHGYIRYSMRAEIQNKKGKTKVKSADSFFKIGYYEEYDQEGLERLTQDQQKLKNRKEISTLVGRSCYTTGNVTMSAHTDKLVYNGGQSINTRVRVDNECSIKTGTIEVALVRITTYKDLKVNTKYSKHVVQITEKQLLDQEVSTNDMIDTKLSVPQGIYPTMEIGCQCIKVNYYVQVRLKLSSKARKVPMVTIPVIIVSSASSLPSPPPPPPPPSSSSSSPPPPLSSPSSSTSSPQQGHLENGQPERSTNDSPEVSCTDLSACSASLVNSGYIDDEQDVTVHASDVISKDDTRL